MKNYKRFGAFSPNPLKQKLSKKLTLLFLMVSIFVMQANTFSNEFVLDEVNILLTQQSVSGTITDADGQPIPDVSVVEKGTSNGVASDFDGNGRKDIVLSYYNFGKLFPVRGKSCSSQQMPSLSSKFQDYGSFAKADVTEVYGKEKLEEAEIHYKAQTFASSYLENLGDGKFKLTELPNEAQFSSVNKIISNDVDKDGFKDLIIAGNLYASEIETPRNDSSVGLYLKGNGNGKFTVLSSSQSGLFLSGDVKDLATLTIGTKKAIISAKNNDTPQVVKIK